MRKTRANLLRLIGLIAFLTMVAAGCGGAGGGGGATGDIDLSGAELTVGSKEFTEQLILGQITLQALEAAGATVNDQIGLAGTVAARKALESGEIDMYWEYTGTGWITYLGHTDPIPGRQEQFEAVANIGQAIPSIGLLAILAIIWTGGFWPAVVALVAYSFLSILRNTMGGVQQVDRSTIEATRGMGMTKWAVLFRIELPLAVPIILAGVRTALIIKVGTATLTTFTGAGTLGELINNALRLGREDTVLVVGSGLTAILALFIDWLGSVAEDILRPRGL